jgi:hypothetical protein
MLAVCQAFFEAHSSTVLRVVALSALFSLLICHSAVSLHPHQRYCCCRAVVLICASEERPRRPAACVCCNRCVCSSGTVVHPTCYTLL